ncbi:RTX toxins and related Ca2+-binding protein [Plesiocystis pacifica SIR-1]|uniref:RTX toxins and related Ca2+-binding protein n=1 Tax=Plesiocystis pacifica SIR-1 TaxID=391625 RepID=A6GAG4_9BACT|nr:hypothetical protein [Plesiocystis pacifica]EDM77152.1 RTX toxins and related Ca2+-binding protein [Plesiocystis pacifica SIR-1]
MSISPRSPRVTVLSLLALAAAGLVTACDPGPIHSGEQEAGALEYEGELIDAPDPDLEPTDQSCDQLEYGMAAPCLDGESIAFCQFDWANDDLEFNFGECMPAAEVECVPGDTREIDDWCGTLISSCVLVDSGPFWTQTSCEDEGGDTPLVLRFDDAPITMIAAESTPAASFDIAMADDHSSCISTDWPSADTPWLAVDLDGNGSIDGGHELFGSGTVLRSGARASDGFLALAEFDGNGDGLVDGRDPRFGELLVWRDLDADRRSTPAELEPLSAAGVDALSVRHVDAPTCDERGNCAVERSSFGHAGGVGELVDLHLSCQ